MTRNLYMIRLACLWAMIRIEQMEQTSQCVGRISMWVIGWNRTALSIRICKQSHHKSLRNLKDQTNMLTSTPNITSSSTSLTNPRYSSEWKQLSTKHPSSCTQFQLWSKKRFQLETLTVVETLSTSHRLQRRNPITSARKTEALPKHTKRTEIYCSHHHQLVRRPLAGTLKSSSNRHLHTKITDPNSTFKKYTIHLKTIIWQTTVTFGIQYLIKENTQLIVSITRERHKFNKSQQIKPR